MPAKLERCVAALKAEGKSEEQAYAICNAQFNDNKPQGEVFVGHFSDEMSWDAERKTAVSVRDGVLEYLGLELGLEPSDKIFRVYRSPATIANAAPLMVGIPLTDDHVELNVEVTNPCGSVLDSQMIDLFDERYDSKLAVRNTVDVRESIRGALATGKRQLSLGYTAQLVPHDEYDFEQKNILPQHLAVVQDGRCGSSCSFIDRKPNDEVIDMPKEAQDKGAKNEPKLSKVFADADGQPNLEQIVEIAQELPEALRKLPMDKLQEIMPSLQEIVSMAKGAQAPSGEEPMQDAEEDVPPEDASAQQDGDMEMKDSAKFKDAVAAEAKKIADKQTASAAAKAVKDHGAVVEKARKFLAEDYNFSDKSTDQVMRDALATQIDEDFEDSAELRMAFKLLRRQESSTKDFGDKAINQNGFAALADKEI